MQPPSLDFVLIWVSTIAPRLPPGCIENALDGMRSRLEHARVGLWDEAGTGKIECQPAITEGPISRVIVIPFSLFPIPRPDLRSQLWFRGLSLDLPIFEADPPTLQEWTHWIGVDREMPTDSVVELIPPDPSDQPCLERIAALAYWIGLHRPCRIRHRQAADHDHLAGHNLDYLPFSEAAYRISTDRGDRGVMTARGCTSYRHGTVQPWKWLSHEPLADWLMGRFLQASNSPPILNVASPQNEILHQVLRDLARSQFALLPKAYEGSLEDISPNSMGSAKLVYGDDGKVPWDRIWTSFCDLAMAGGPPHRGTLLTAPSSEEIKMRMDEYATVVAEIQRGILLASRLPTRESESLGWVGVCCHNEEMAAWMLRAIIAENILVRREGSVIYLPAAPGFRIDKEIKNVITAVAKTTHYWLGHLKMRQPPKPL